MDNCPEKSLSIKIIKNDIVVHINGATARIVENKYGFQILKGSTIIKEECNISEHGHKVRLALIDYGTIIDNNNDGSLYIFKDSWNVMTFGAALEIICGNPIQNVPEYSQLKKYKEWNNKIEIVSKNQNIDKNIEDFEKVMSFFSYNSWNPENGWEKMQELAFHGNDDALEIISTYESLDTLKYSMYLKFSLDGYSEYSNKINEILRITPYSTDVSRFIILNADKISKKYGHWYQHLLICSEEYYIFWIIAQNFNNIVLKNESDFTFESDIKKLLSKIGSYPEIVSDIVENDYLMILISIYRLNNRDKKIRTKSNGERIIINKLNNFIDSNYFDEKYVKYYLYSSIIGGHSISKELLNKILLSTDSLEIREKYSQILKRYYTYEAKQGNMITQFILGREYYTGGFIEKDNTEAWRWLNLSFKKGYDDAIIYLNQLDGNGPDETPYVVAIKNYLGGDFIKPNYSDGWKNLMIAVYSGDEKAINAYEVIRKHPQYIEQYIHYLGAKEGIKYGERLLDQELSNISYSGNVSTFISKNKIDLLNYYSNRETNGDLTAKFILGRQYYFGDGMTELNKDKAHELLEEAAINGENRAFDLLDIIFTLERKNITNIRLMENQMEEDDTLYIKSPEGHAIEVINNRRFKHKVYKSRG